MHGSGDPEYDGGTTHHLVGAGKAKVGQMSVVMLAFKNLLYVQKLKQENVYG